MSNEIMARLLFAHKLASREQIMTAMGLVSEQKNIGMVLLEKGVINRNIYGKLIAYVKQQATETAIPQPSQPAKPEAQAEQPALEYERILVDYPPIYGGSVQEQIKEELPFPFEGKTGYGTLQVAIPQSLDGVSDLNQIFCFARKMKASDVHICPGVPIIYRQFGQLVSMTQSPVNQSWIESVIRKSFGDDLYQKFLGCGDLEFVHPIEGGGRYRVTLMRENFGFDLTARVIPMRIMSYEECGLPEICQGLTKWAQGMVLVTGPIGSGKSSTLAVLVELINQSRDDHIISIESPIEMVFKPGRCQITQRELDMHTLSQENALRAALRQDPDIIVISELRDLKSIQLAVSAAETGHLVLATMNTASATRTIYRLIDSFPPEEQGIIRNMVSLSLRGVISQQLIPKKDRTGVVPAYEVLLVTTAISNLIRKNNSHLIESAMVTGKSSGMVLLDDSLETLYKQGAISGKEAYYRAINPKRFVAVKDK